MQDNLSFISSFEHDFGGHRIPPTIVQMKTPIGALYVAFSNHDLANDYLLHRAIDKTCFIVSREELTEDFLFDFAANSVLLIASETHLLDLLNNPETFDFKKHVIRYEHSRVSKHPR
jgi:hypothetical protein